MANSIGILAPHGKYFAAEHLAHALKARLFSDLEVILYRLSSKELNVEHLIIIGMRALERYKKLKEKNFKSVAVIFSDTNFCRYYKWCNEYTLKNNIPIYATPDLNDYCLQSFTPVYHTITLPKIEINKPDNKIVICHSPGEKADDNIKGTEQIGIIINKLSKKYNIEYLVLKNLSWKDCIKAKSTAHIFIDQLTKNNPFIDQKRFGGEIHYNGALGKSGIEGMLLKCCTITTMDFHETAPFFPFPPVVLTDYFDLMNVLEILINDTKYRNSLIKDQYEWVKKYCSPEFVVMNVTRHINETV